MIDIVAAIIILYGFYTGYQKGLIKTLFATLSILLAVLVCLKLSPVVIDWIEGILKLSPAINYILGFVLTFFIVMIGIRFIGSRLEGLLKAVNINFINKIAGGLLMGAVFAVCLGFLVHLADNLNLIDDKNKQASIAYPVLNVLPSHATVLFEKAKPVFTDFWDKTVETIDQVKIAAEKE